MFSSLLTAIIFGLGLQSVNVAAQSASAYCDSTSSICYEGYTDPTINITIGIILPPLSTGSEPNRTEFIAEIVAPVSFGWTGLSVGGQMADSLLFTVWPYNNEVIFGPRWTSGYVQPLPYTGPLITMLPDTMVNSTHIKASFRCENCTAWNGGSLGTGDLSGFQLIAYVASDDTPVDDPSNVASNFTEHDQMNFFGLDLSTAHSADYDTYWGAQVEYGQCGGSTWTGPTVCGYGLTCEYSSAYYSQCVAA
ncbi:carbohydrate-binding module family 1 protein [Hygrophoropsis aurantiaca]|uniref:Carbohydrate-binding module family 1 protein n=1 Tax=Hygrophoropsis aurantiaca TaxID=72124 RepID=A0ACB8A5J0_9AGAM|nr:carbohydrate-binding module family 1 protein [Hygrophoropsis aurantiaca]